MKTLTVDYTPATWHFRPGVALPFGFEPEH